MRQETKIIDIYTFDELSEEGKQRAIEKYSDINTNFNWWIDMYEDAYNVGIKIEEFSLYRHTIKCKFIEGAYETAEKIAENHGDTCETHKLAMRFLEDRDNLVDTASRDDDGEFENEYVLDKALDNLEAEFLREIGTAYLSLLRREYEYRTSEEAIIETIKANEYEFTIDGSIY